MGCTPQVGLPDVSLNLVCDLHTQQCECMLVHGFCHTSVEPQIPAAGMYSHPGTILLSHQLDIRTCCSTHQKQG